MRTNYTQLQRNLLELKLPICVENVDEVSTLVTSGALSFTEGLLKLTNQEIENRCKNA